MKPLALNFHTLLLCCCFFTCMLGNGKVSMAQEKKTAVLTVLHRGKEFRLYRHTEYLTGKTELIDKKTPGQDSLLVFRSSLNNGEWLVLMNNLCKSTIFVAPGDSIVVSLPAPDSLIPPSLAGEPEVTPSFLDSSSAGSNLQLIKFNSIISDFYTRYSKQLQNARSMRQTLDSLKSAVVAAMPTTLDQGIKDHIRYTLASIEDIVLPNKLFLHARYFRGNIKWRCPAYFNYLKVFYKDYLYTLSLEEKGKKINHAINISSSLEVLDSAFILADHYKMNDTLRNIVILKGLSEIYFKKGYERVKVDRIMEQIKLKSRHPAISIMAENILQQCWLMGTGASLPAIQFERSDGRFFSTDSLRGKKTLISFYASWSRESMQDMLLLQKLEQKYGHRIRFISVMTDGERDKALQWKKEKKLTWDFLFDEKKKLTRDKWHIQKVPHYLLLDEDGDILKFDAPAPDENLEFLLKNELKAQKP